MSVITSPKLDKSVTIPNAPSMKFVRIGPINNGSTVTITPAGGANDTIFELPANTSYMLPDALFQWSQGTVATALMQHWMNLDSYGAIRELTLRTKAGTIICQVRNFAQFMKIMNFYNTKKEEYLERMHNNLTTTNIFAPSQALVAANLRQTGAAVASAIDYYENRHLLTDVVLPAALGNPLNIPNVQLPLNIPETVFGIRKLMMTPEVLELVISWNPAQNFMWDSPVLGDPSGGGAPVVPVANTVLTGLCLWLPVDQNPVTKAQLQAEIQSGRFTMTIPFVIPKVDAIGLVQNQVVDVTILPSQGRKLRKIYHSAFSPNATLNLINDNTNVGAVKLINYRTLFNSIPEQDFPLTCGANGTDYFFNKPYHKGSYVINQDLFNYCHCHIADYTDGTTRAENDSKDNLSAGIPITNTIKWSFDSNTPAVPVALTHYNFAIVEKVLSISAQTGITVI